MNVADDPRRPTIEKVIEPEEVVAKTGYTRPHTVSHRLLSHYSLLQASEKLLGIRRYLGKARLARGLPKAFHL